MNQIISDYGGDEMHENILTTETKKNLKLSSATHNYHIKLKARAIIKSYTHHF